MKYTTWKVRVFSGGLPHWTQIANEKEKATKIYHGEEVLYLKDGAVHDEDPKCQAQRDAYLQWHKEFVEDIKNYKEQKQCQKIITTTI